MLAASALADEAIAFALSSYIPVKSHKPYGMRVGGAAEQKTGLRMGGGIN